MPKVSTNVEVLQQIRHLGITPRITAAVKYAEEEAVLREAGADRVFNVYAQAGAGYVANILEGPSARRTSG